MKSVTYSSLFCNFCHKPEDDSLELLKALASYKN